MDWIRQKDSSGSGITITVLQQFKDSQLLVTVLKAVMETGKTKTPFSSLGLLHQKRLPVRGLYHSL
jgi:hypothetical protein